jgi:FecR protein
MRVSRPNIKLILSLLLILFSITTTARADDDEPDEYDVKARVVRISLIEGEVNLKRNGNQDWERARLNYPLVEGDTVATDKDSRLEIQVDARNFVRLTANSVLRIVTLRDEGIALSVVEGTATVRLAKFDNSREYFEIDAPKTTLAAEKTGFYRIDVPREGRVRLTVRDGGSARIYSDTSGFALRDGRSAELVISGDNAGDWDLLAAAPRDAIDDWTTERERYLAHRLRYDVKYFDEYVWGAEDLDAYGDWTYADEFGWIWRPRASALSSYADWAPYRYGHWAWVPPYGWTWIGYEPWGWAPYHYGRWVYHNNYWAWCPRSQFHRNRSWWRPALVAFVANISFGSDICWYPLSYYQRDPHSRRYRHDDDRRHRYGRPGGGQNDRPRYDGDKTWRGVTRVPRRDFGNPDGRTQRVDEPVARRVIESEPQREKDLPRRGSFRTPVVHVPDRPTGATERTPGVALDEDLRRSRVFRWRAPRVAEPNPTATTPATETRPTGAVARPDAPSRSNPNRGEPRRSEPRQELPGASNQPSDRPAGQPSDQPPDQPRSADPSRLVRPTRPEGSDKRIRNQQRIEETPRTTPEPRTEAPVTPVAEPPRAEPRPESQPEPRSEPVRSNPRSEPREEPRSEPRESRPEPRSEPSRSESQPAPRAEPRSEPREARPEPRSEPPRSESQPAPRSEPRSEPRESRPEPRPEPPARSESPRSESPRSESPRSEAPRSESPRSESPKSESPRSESPKKPDNLMF